jgi:polyhydroxyalkanoate synthase subunit PhaC
MMLPPSGMRTEQPAPLSRRGPRPLLLHLTLAVMRPGGFMSALPNWNLAFQHLNGSEGANPSDPERLKQAFETAASQDRDLVAGIAAYRRDPYYRNFEEPPLVWAEAETRLLNFSGRAVAGSEPAVLFVPSLVNRAYILDLMPDASMLRWLAGQGIHPYLLDWGWPGESERKFTLTDYVAGRLERAIAQIPGPIVLAGYCMGGLLALAAALRQPEKIQALALLATPWDFQAASPAQAKSLSDTLPMLEPMMQFSGTLPIDALQTLFTMIDPFGVGEKYRSFAQADKSSLRARRFVAMEDWLADGVPLAAPVAREAIGGWYGGNNPAHGNWRIAGLAIEPARFEGPVFCAIPARDRLVPPESARPLAAAFKNATIIEPAAGHIGMIAGTNAKDALWQPFANWLQGLS